MTFLTGWRLALAADLLREPDATIGAVAQQVGYGSPFALSTAFKRVRGVSPKQHRQADRGVRAELLSQARVRRSYSVGAASSGATAAASAVKIFRLALLLAPVAS